MCGAVEGERHGGSLENGKGEQSAEQLRHKQHEEIELNKQRGVAHHLGVGGAEEAQNFAVRKPPEGEQAAENRAEENGDCRKNQCVAQSFKQEHVPVVPQKGD